MGKNKLTALNKTTKAQILSKVKELIKLTKKTEIDEKVKQIKTDLTKQLPSSSMDIIKTDYIILSYLKEIESDVEAEFFALAKIRLDNLFAQLTLRDAYSKDTATKLKDKLEKADNKKIKKIIKATKRAESFLDVEEVKVPVEERYLEDQIIDIVLLKARTQADAYTAQAEEVNADENLDPFAKKGRLIRINAQRKFASDVANLKRSAISKAMGTMTEAQKQTMINSTFTNEHYNLLLNALKPQE